MDLRFTLLLSFPALLFSAAPSFNRDVRPILSDKCFACHGPDAKTKNIPLRLDVETEARRVIDSGELVRRITAENAARRMPPAFTGHKLSEQEVTTLREWIAAGARWEKHWAFLKPERPALPDVKDTAWPRNPIDRFVLARLEREGLRPAAAASRETLLRRASLDLTGLPPTPAEVDRFVSDKSSDAYEKAVDRLLESKRYGERMAARWLDAARYADSNGYQFDGERVMWRWRDWVINAFNRNQPYNRFVVEQLAGDLLPNATFEQKLATGFNRNHRGNTEDGIVPEEYAVEYVVDRVETTSTVFLGLTLGCTRCHNHKYDPFTQKEFYKLFAYFNNVPESGRAMKYGNSPPLIPAPTDEQREALRRIEERIAGQKALLARHEAAIAAYRAPAGAVRWWPAAGLDVWFPFDNVSSDRAAPGKFNTGLALDGTRFADFGGAAQYDIDDHFSFAAWVKPESLTGAVLSRMNDEERGKGIGIYLREGRVHVHLTSNYDSDVLRVDTKEKLLETGRWQHIGVTYNGSVQAAGITIYVDGKAAPFTVDQETLYRPFRNAGRAYSQPLRIGAGGGAANRFRGAIDDVLAYSRVLTPEEVAGIAGTAPRAFLDRMQYLESKAPAAVHDIWREIGKLEFEKDRLERTFPTSMIMSDGGPKPTHLLIRGAYDKPGERVEPGVPEALPPLPAGAPNNRLGFAQWLVDPSHPLTARVAVNRYWQMYFGTGLVKTTEDFGQQGEWPSHPELLDWLATEFQRIGWDVKAMQKLIVTSATYMQSSKATPDLLQRDPDNRLLARGPRYRLPAETIRDQALFNAGLMAEKLGGPSVKPYQPDGLWNELAMQDMYYVQGKGADLYRRSLYTFWKRTIAPPMMLNFDAANREACVVRENRTNTPLQALNLMNDVTFLEAARFVGQRMLLEGGATPESRLRHGFRIVLGRQPDPREIQVARANLNYHLDYFADAEKAGKFVAQGDTPADKSITPRDLAAYASTASLLMNLDEAVSKE